jgi:transglutaminase-like putative cysteine protease
MPERSPMTAGVLLALLLSALFACASLDGVARHSPRGPTVFAPNALRRAVIERVPELADDDVPVPYEVDPETIGRAREYVSRHFSGKDKLQALIRFIRAQNGLALVYDRGSLYTARETLEYGSGNCLALASVLIGLARGLGWEARFVEMRVRNSEPYMEGDIAVAEQHMVVKLWTGRAGAYVDYSGKLDFTARLHIVDDLRATSGYYVNSAYAVIRAANNRGEPVPWTEVARRFDIAVRIAPDSAQAWNNLGVARARLGEHEAAEIAYLRAIELKGTDTAQRNLVLLQGQRRRQ